MKPGFYTCTRALVCYGNIHGDMTAEEYAVAKYSHRLQDLMQFGHVPSGEPFLLIDHWEDLTLISVKFSFEAKNGLMGPWYFKFINEKENVSSPCIFYRFG